MFLSIFIAWLLKIAACFIRDRFAERITNALPLTLTLTELLSNFVKQFS